MLTANNDFDAWSGTQIGKRESNDLAQPLRKLYRSVSGVDDLRVLSRRSRPGHERHKVFVVYTYPDVDRDERIISALSDLDIDMDLVPAASVGMIPDEARSVLNRG